MSRPALRQTIYRRLASESGFAVPTVLLMTIAALGMASVAVMTSIQGQSGTVRDQGSKEALAVAESGVSQALLHYNRGVAPCEPAGEGEWCGPVAGMSVNGGGVSYWTRLASGEECEVGNEVECVEIVSVGTAGGVSRRVSVMASTVSTEESGGPGPFASAGVLSLETIDLDSNSEIHTGVATDGDLELRSNAEQCGPVSVGIGKKLILDGNAEWHGDTDCDGPELDSDEALQQELTLPAVNQGDAPESNDNDRFFDQDVISDDDEGFVCWSGFDGEGQSTNDCGERELELDSNSSLTLGGSVYSFCKLTLNSNSAVYVAAGAEVTIYFDSPENCGYASGVRQLDLQSNSRVTAAEGDPVSVAMLFVGSDNLDTGVLLNSNTEVDGPCEQNFVVYAPRSDVHLDSNSKFCGALAGRSVEMDSNAEIWSASGSESYELPGVEVPETAAHYSPYRFVECSAASAEPPNAGC